MAEIDLDQRFPHMRPITRSPGLWLVNGCGVTVYGARDRDEETGTYVKTHCLCLLYVPILALGAYRVADAAQGWYFVGKERLSAVAFVWNLLVLSAALGLGGAGLWSSYTGSPEYKAGRTLAKADDLSASGDVAGAALLYADVATGPTKHAGAAIDALGALVSGGLQQATLKDAAAVFAAAVRVKRAKRGSASLGDLFARAQSLIAAKGTADAEGAIALLDAVAPLAPDDATLRNARLPLLEAVVAQKPDNVQHASALAVIYEEQGETDKCRAVLAPRADKLGLTEGARVLGQIYAGDGEFDKAYALLEPYAAGRLQRLHDAEETYNKAIEAAWRRAVSELEKGRGPQSFYKKYDRASEAARQQLVTDYVQSKVKGDRSIESAQQALVREASVVPVALDLGIVQLRRAQTLGDQDARRQELEAAEKTFLAIRGVAGESDQYRVYLGQVYYWLGKHAQGKALFDEVLKSNGRSHEMLMTVASTLRDLGAESEARVMIEEAYKNAKKTEDRQAAAAFRAVMEEDDDDERIAWLGRANTASPQVKADLAATRGRKAQRQNKSDEAAGQFRQAIDAYGGLPRSAATLNNAGLIYFQLFEVTADRDDFKQGVKMVDQAVAMAPSDSILLFNAASALVQGVVLDVMGDRIDLAVLRSRPAVSLLSYLYDDDAGRAQVADRFRKHPDTVKALAYLDKVLVLSPKRAPGYEALAWTLHTARDTDALIALRDRLRSAELDLKDYTTRTRQFLKGERDAKSLTEYDQSLKLRAAALDRAKSAAAPLTFAVASALLSQQMVEAATLRDNVDAAEAIRLAQEAHAAAPCSATRGALIDALWLRVHQGLRGRHTGYRKLADKTRRGLSPSFIIALAAELAEPLRAELAADADAQRAAALLIEQGSRFPDNAAGHRWALLRYVNPQEAARVAEAIRIDTAGAAMLSITQKLAPMSSATAYELYWAGSVLGDRDAALAALKRSLDSGVPVELPVGK